MSKSRAKWETGSSKGCVTNVAVRRTLIDWRKSTTLTKEKYLSSRLTTKNLRRLTRKWTWRHLSLQFWVWLFCLTSKNNAIKRLELIWRSNTSSEVRKRFKLWRKTALIKRRILLRRRTPTEIIFRLQGQSKIRKISGAQLKIRSNQGILSKKSKTNRKKKTLKI